MLCGRGETIPGQRRDMDVLGWKSRIRIVYVRVKLSYVEGIWICWDEAGRAG